MTEEEFRAKWAHIPDERLAALVEGPVIDLVVEAVQAIEYLTVVEHLEEAGAYDEESAEFVHDVLTDSRLGEIIREALT